MSIEVMKQALEALESSRVFVTTREKIKHPEGTDWYDEAITALRLAIEQAERQEPVAWIDRAKFRLLEKGLEGVLTTLTRQQAFPEDVPLFTAPQRQPLTEEEIEVLWGEFMSAKSDGYIPDFVRAIERAHGIGGGE